MKKHYSQEQVDKMLEEQASRITTEMLEKFKGYKSRKEVKKIVWLSRIFFTEHQYAPFSNLRNSFDKWFKENV